MTERSLGGRFSSLEAPSLRALPLTRDQLRGIRLSESRDVPVDLINNTFDTSLRRLGLLTELG